MAATASAVYTSTTNNHKGRGQQSITRNRKEKADEKHVHALYRATECRSLSTTLSPHRMCTEIKFVNTPTPLAVLLSTNSCGGHRTMPLRRNCEDDRNCTVWLNSHWRKRAFGCETAATMLGL